MLLTKGPTVLPTAIVILSGFLVELILASASCPGLQVKMDPPKVKKGSRVKLTCSTTCSLSNNPTYIWYKNSQPVINKHTANGNTLTINSINNDYSGRYSCAVRGHEDLPSPAVCVWSCNGVAYKPERVCALEGTSVDLHSYYSYHDQFTVKETFWFVGNPKDIDLMTKEHYKDRVTYTGGTNSHSLSIRNLNIGDSGEYGFSFTVYRMVWHFSIVPLTVTGLKVVVRPASVDKGDRVTLTCSTTCSLSNNPSYIWYKNSQPVTNKYTATGNTLTINSATTEDVGVYSCAVEGHQSLVSLESALNFRYGPRNTLASADPSGDPKEGNSVNLRCSSDASPLPQFTWYKKTGGQSSSVSSHQNYKMEDIRSEQSGFYYCDAQNEMGKDKSAEIRINVEYAPRDISVSVSHPANIKEGDSVTLTCSSDANPPVESYTWYKKLGSTPSSSRFRGGSYIITSITAKDSGHYYCTAGNKYGVINSSITHLNVIYGPRNTLASVDPSGDPKEGDSVNLRCSSDANPPPQFAWYKKTGGQSSAVSSSQIYQIDVIRSEQSGLYYCNAQNEMGKDKSAEIRINVEYAPRDISVSVSHPANIKEGDSVTLTCSSDANPPVESYTWYKKLGSTPSSSRFRGGSYIISNITAKDSGHYYCTAENKYGAINSSTTHLDVLYGPRNTTASVHPSGDPKEGDSVNLRCSSDANPPPQFTWYKKTGGQPSAVSSSQIYKIENIRSEQSGLYYCEAQNAMGKDKAAEIRINVEYGPKQTSVSVSPPGDIKDGDSVTLTCSSDANPPVENYTWYRGAGYDTVFLGNGRILNFTFVSGLDGVYHCEAGNELGKGNSTQVWISKPDSGLYRMILFPVLKVILALGLLLLVIIRWRSQKFRLTRTAKRMDYNVQMSKLDLSDPGPSQSIRLTG